MSNQINIPPFFDTKKKRLIIGLSLPVITLLVSYTLLQPSLWIAVFFISILLCHPFLSYIPNQAFFEKHQEKESTFEGVYFFHERVSTFFPFYEGSKTDIRCNLDSCIDEKYGRYLMKLKGSITRSGQIHYTFLIEVHDIIELKPFLSE
ncbi:MAG: hypothetical protein CL920_24995 [Deltaproteobacteria bacterium]|nr:hypothetical protein [Deltaproteobacteria bacterium]MBU49796.1 hypothetical protein [Deltaproteobacteria bacterium]MBU51962.1 hypothetical protein [Deltaproteobacteria bacterium]|tara:strand:+ start:1540 stop:1986 length:447 start_codon:yes stop_codon:yes gene_type:complete